MLYSGKLIEKKTVLFNEIPGGARKCKIMRLTIGAEALILMAMKFHERRNNTR